MKVKNFRVHYLIKGSELQIDFSVWNLIDRMTIGSAAKRNILKAHPGVNQSDISVISIEEIIVW